MWKHLLEFFCKISNKLKYTFSFLNFTMKSHLFSAFFSQFIMTCFIVSLCIVVFQSKCLVCCLNDYAVNSLVLNPHLNKWLFLMVLCSQPTALPILMQAFLPCKLKLHYWCSSYFDVELWYNKCYSYFICVRFLMHLCLSGRNCDICQCIPVW